MVIILMGFISSFGTYTAAGSYMLSIFIVNTLLVALIEEFTFRGLILPVILKTRKNKKNRVFVSVVITSVVFGVLHYINLLREPDNFWGITSQASTDFVVPGSRTRHILWPVIIHFLVNFSFGSGDLKEVNPSPVVESTGASVFDAGDLITLLLFVFIASGGWYMTRKADEAWFLEKLDAHQNDLNSQ
jgi:membrane protease YdiL (CAAX protease family)